MLEVLASSVRSNLSNLIYALARVLEQSLSMQHASETAIDSPLLFFLYWLKCSFTPHSNIGPDDNQRWDDIGSSAP